MAADCASRSGVEVTLADSMPTFGRKIPYGWKVRTQFNHARR